MYYLIKHSYLQENESGELKSHKGQILFDAVSFTEAESRFWEHIEKEGSVGGVVQDRDIDDIRPQRFNEIGKDNGGAWFQIKAHYNSLNEKSGKEKRVGMKYLVNAEDTPAAVEEFKKLTSAWLDDVYCDTIAETKIDEVIIPRKE